MAAIAGIGGFLSNLFLLLALIAAVNALIWLRFDGSYHAFLGTLPGFPGLMELLNTYILNPGDSMHIQALKLAGTAYASSILVFVLLSILIRLLYHPLKKQIPGGTYAEQTSMLATAAREAKTYSSKTRLSPSMASIMISIIFVVALFLAYIIYVGDAEKMKSLLRIFPTQDENLNCTLYALACYLPFGLASWLRWC